LDSPCNRSSYKETVANTNKEIIYTCDPSTEHYVEFCYSKDGSVDTQKLFAYAENNKIDFIYTDEDKIDLDGKRCDPNFKSDYAPDSLLSSNYFCHFTLLRKSILDEIGGWRKGFEGAQDYDLFLRFTEKTKRIYHIPKILYHWIYQYSIRILGVGA
jgi:hypothetical protein